MLLMKELVEVENVLMNMVRIKQEMKKGWMASTRGYKVVGSK